MFLNPSSAQPTMNISQQQQSQQQQSRPGDKFPPNTRVFIGNVDNAHVTKADLRNIFEKYGKLQEEPRLHKGFAFVQYDNTKSAEEAIKNENGRLLGNKRIDVSYAKGTRDKSKQAKTSKKRTRDQASDKPAKKRLLEEQPVQPFMLGTNLQPVTVVPIYVIHTALSEYAQYVAGCFRNAGINTKVQYIDSRNFQNVLDDALAERVRYTVSIRRKNEVNRTISFRAVAPDGSTPGFADIPIQDAIQYIISNEPRQQLTVNNTLGPFHNSVLTPQNGISPIIQQQSRPNQVDISSLQGISPNSIPPTRDQYPTTILPTQQHTQDLQSAESTVQSNQDLQSLLVTLLGSLQQQENQGNTVSQQTQQTSVHQQYVPEQGIQNTHQSLLQGQSSSTSTTQQQTQQSQTTEMVPQTLINLLNTLTSSLDQQQSAPQGNQSSSVQNSSDPNQYNPQQYQYT